MSNLAADCSGQRRFGVVGHRLLLEEAVLRAAVRAAISMLATHFQDQQIVIYSSLAEGADRLVVEEAIEHYQAALVAVLPMPIAEYLEDCTDDDSRNAFHTLLERAVEIITLPACTSRLDAYWQAGTYVVDHVDAVIALWDGRPAQGKSGTAEVVAYARSRCLPLVWVHAGNRVAGTDIPTTLGAEQGRITVERLPG